MKPTPYRAAVQRFVPGAVSFCGCILAAAGGGLSRPLGSPAHLRVRCVMKPKNGESDDQVHQILRSMPERFAMAKAGVSAATQQEYLAFTAHIEHEQRSEEDIRARSEALFSSTTAIAEKKEILARLAHAGTLDAYRVLEQFAETAEPELQDWSTLALHECRLLLEQDWDEPVGLVMTGLGGEEDRLRYFIVVCSKDSAVFSQAHPAIIESAFSATCDRLRSILEEVQVHASYATLKVLVPLDVAVGTVVEGGISECNKRGSLLDESYYVTNDRIPTEAEIL